MALKKGWQSCPFFLRLCEVTSRGRNETDRYPLAGSAGRFRFLLSALQDRPAGPLLERAAWGNWFLWGLGLLSGFCRLGFKVSFSFDCHAMVRPFAFLSRSKGLLPRFASPAGGHFLLRQKVTKERPGILPGPGEPAKGSGLGRMTHGPPDLTHGAGSMVGSTLIYYQHVPTDGARRLGCAGGLDLCSRLPASGLSRPEARWPDKVLFSAEKSGALRAMACGPGWNGFGASG